MAITFEQIQKANEGLNAIDVKGKRYVMVNEKVKAFRMLYPEGFIQTDLLSLENGVAVMKAKAGVYENGEERILGTGMAFESQSSSFINKTSYIENCETSAIGRALSFLYLGADDSIASAEELANAINNQNKQKEQDIPNVPAGKPFIPPKATTKAVGTKVDKVESANEDVKKYIADEMVAMGEAFGIPDKNQMFMRFMAMRQSLIEAKIIEDVSSDKQTMEQAKDMIDAMYKNFKPSGEMK